MPHQTQRNSPPLLPGFPHLSRGLDLHPGAQESWILDLSLSDTCPWSATPFTIWITRGLSVASQIFSAPQSTAGTAARVAFPQLSTNSPHSSLSHPLPFMSQPHRVPGHFSSTFTPSYFRPLLPPPGRLPSSTPNTGMAPIALLKPCPCHLSLTVLNSLICHICPSVSHEFPSQLCNHLMSWGLQ